MRPIIQELIKKFSGTTIFIVGGGASLKDFDFSRLNGKNVIAVNSAYKYVDENAVLYWGDTSWGQDESENLLKHPSKYKFSSRLHVDLTSNPTGPGGCYWLRKTGSEGFDPDVNSVRGNNSGAHAINFSINLGARRVVLLGFDMSYSGTKSHFHNHHSRPTPASVYPELFIPSIESMAEAIKHLPVEVINANKNSKLKCFKFGNIEDYL